MVTSLILVGACSRGTTYAVGRNLVAIIEVGDEIERVDYAGGATALEVTITEVLWVGHPVPWAVEVPAVNDGDRLHALRLSGANYREGETYAASLNYFGDDQPSGYGWWLDEGLDAEGRVVTNKDTSGFQTALDLADAVDGDVDSPGALLTEYASEWEDYLNARDAGVPEVNLPLGPMLTAVFAELG
ncbi:MAG TPA: hypothetical protein VID03_04650 [Acidimicrobiia bacterium]